DEPTSTSRPLIPHVRLLVECDLVRVRPVDSGRRHGSHARQVRGFASSHAFAAAAPDRWPSTIEAATRSWSALVQLNRLIRSYAGPPLAANFDETSLLRW